jgi:hypothetical protein
MRKKIVILLTLVLWGAILAACNFEPDINKQARAEAAKFVDEAEKSYISATEQMDAVFAEPPGADKLASLKSRKPKLEEAAAGFKKAQEKFEMASAKFNEALNGGKSADSSLHNKFERLRNAYKKWSELAAVDYQIAQEAINIKDIKSFLSKNEELEARAKKLREQVDAEIKSSRIN